MKAGFFVHSLLCCCHSIPVSPSLSPRTLIVPLGVFIPLILPIVALPAFSFPPTLFHCTSRSLRVPFSPSHLSLTSRIFYRHALSRKKLVARKENFIPRRVLQVLRARRDMSTLPAVSIPFMEMGQPLSTGDWNFTCELQVEYASEENASMVYTALSVDKELQPDKVKRNMVLNGRQLLVQFAAVEARFLRASFSAFVDILVLATRTIEQFGSN